MSHELGPFDELGLGLDYEITWKKWDKIKSQVSF